jgi:hypothetical protein
MQQIDIATRNFGWSGIGMDFPFEIVWLDVTHEPSVTSCLALLHEDLRSLIGTLNRNETICMIVRIAITNDSNISGVPLGG